MAVCTPSYGIRMSFTWEAGCINISPTEDKTLAFLTPQSHAKHAENMLATGQEVGGPCKGWDVNYQL